jgi:hypothetical protein
MTWSSHSVRQIVSVSQSFATFDVPKQIRDRRLPSVTLLRLVGIDRARSGAKGINMMLIKSLNSSAVLVLYASVAHVDVSSTSKSPDHGIPKETAQKPLSTSHCRQASGKTRGLGHESFGGSGFRLYGAFSLVSRTSFSACLVRGEASAC